MAEVKYSHETTPISEMLRNDASSLVAGYFGHEWSVCDWVKLNHKLETQVARLTLEDGNGNRKTAILKYIDSRFYADPATWKYLPEFFEEKINYRYLNIIRERFSRFPEYYAELPGMFLIEDLGPDVFVFNGVDTIITALAETFVMLHESARGTEQLYLQAREMSDAGKDIRKYSAQGCGEVFDQGCKDITDFFSILNIPKRERLEYFLQQARSLVMTESIFWSFVHDDLADRRQSVVLEGKVILLDFEHGKFFHRLIDLSKLLMGKVERDYEKKAMIYHHPHIPTSLGDKYLSIWQQYSPDAPSRDVWEMHFAAANIFQTMMIIGRMNEFHGTEVLYSLAGNLRMILPRLAHHLENNKAFGEFGEILITFTDRIMI